MQSTYLSIDKYVVKHDATPLHRFLAHCPLCSLDLLAGHIQTHLNLLITFGEPRTQALVVLVHGDWSQEDGEAIDASVLCVFVWVVSVSAVACQKVLVHTSRRNIVGGWV